MKRNLLILMFALNAALLQGQGIPVGYYDSANGLGGDALKTQLYNIIKNHVEYLYTADTTDVWDILKETDKDPSNPDNVILLYTGWSVNAAQEWNSGNGWSREHVWAKSRGQFDPDIFGPGAGTDVHNLGPADPSVNTARNNRWFAECTTEYIDPDGPTGSYIGDEGQWVWKPRDEVKGDVARMIFYMAVRYEGENGEPDLEVVDYFPPNDTQDPVHALFSDLLQWHVDDPVDDWERNRNDIIYSYQKNRNPFIDHPEWIQCIWNNNCTGLWYTSYPDTLMNDREDYSYSVSASCADNSVLSIEAVTVPLWLNFELLTSIEGGATALLSGSPEFTDIGTHDVSIKIWDGTNELFQNFRITVTDGNPLSFTSIPVTEVVVDEVYTYTVTATGDEGANFTLTAEQLPSWLSLTENTGDFAVLTGTPGSENIGLNNVVLILTDEAKKIISQEFEIQVINPGDVNRIIISQYYEGASSDKYIEITNTGTTPVDLSDYYLARWANTDSPTGVYTSGGVLSGIIASGETQVYKNANAANPAYAVSLATGSTEATYVNGNDPVALLRYGNTWEHRVDCIYASIAGDTYWGLDIVFYRKPDVLTGSYNMSVLDGSGEWVQISVDEANTALPETSEYLGYHIFNAANSIYDLSKLSLGVFPNPVNESLYIDFKGKINSIQVISITGRVLLETVNYEGVLSVSQLSSGMYILRIEDNNNIVYYQKFIKK